MSSAVKAVRYLLANDSGLTAVVPPDRVVAAWLGEGTKLPAVVVSHISTQRRPVVQRGPTQFCTSRVQVTVFAKSYPDQDAVQKLVRQALPPTRAVINSVDVDSIQSGGDGPDIRDDAAGIFMGVSDFIVTFNE
jgi:hypothetical protein